MSSYKFNPGNRVVTPDGPGVVDTAWRNHVGNRVGVELDTARPDGTRRGVYDEADVEFERRRIVDGVVSPSFVDDLAAAARAEADARPIIKSGADARAVDEFGRFTHRAAEGSPAELLPGVMGLNWPPHNYQPTGRGHCRLCNWGIQIHPILMPAGSTRGWERG